MYYMCEQNDTNTSLFLLLFKVGIIAAYQKTMAERMASTEEEREVEKEVVIEEKELEEEEEKSLDDLPGFERQTKGRATVCLGDLKPRCFSGQKWRFLK